MPELDRSSYVSFLTSVSCQVPLGLYQNDTVHTGIVSRITCTSVVIAFVLFTTIVLYHLVITILNSRMGQILTESLRKLIYKHKDDQVG